MSTLEQNQERLLKASEQLVQIVEGVRSQRWARESGLRLKGTPEWCEFYCTVETIMALQRLANDPRVTITRGSVAGAKPEAEAKR